MWNLPGKVLNDEATGCVFMRSCGQLVNVLSSNDIPLKYLLPVFPGYHSLLTFLVLPPHIFPESCDSFSISDSLNIAISRFKSLGLFSSRLCFGEGTGSRVGY